MKNLLSASLPENNSREAVADVAYISNLGEIEAPEVKFHLPVTVSSCDKEAGPPAEVQSSLTNASEAVLVMVKCPASNETEVTWPSGVSPMWPTSMPEKMVSLSVPQLNNPVSDQRSLEVMALSQSDRAAPKYFEAEA